MSEPGRVSSHTRGGRWRRGLRLTGLALQLSLCVGLAMWFASSSETSLFVVAVILGLVAFGLGVREVRGRP